MWLRVWITGLHNDTTRGLWGLRLKSGKFQTLQPHTFPFDFKNFLRFFLKIFEKLSSLLKNFPKLIYELLKLFCKTFQVLRSFRSLSEKRLTSVPVFWKLSKNSLRAFEFLLQNFWSLSTNDAFEHSSQCETWQAFHWLILIVFDRTFQTSNAANMEQTSRSLEISILRQALRDFEQTSENTNTSQFSFKVGSFQTIALLRADLTDSDKFASLNKTPSQFVSGWNRTFLTGILYWGVEYAGITETNLPQETCGEATVNTQDFSAEVMPVCGTTREFHSRFTLFLENFGRYHVFV